jgi:hypothetical protein
LLTSTNAGEGTPSRSNLTPSNCFDKEKTPGKRTLKADLALFERVAPAVSVQKYFVQYLAKTNISTGYEMVALPSGIEPLFSP